MLKKRTTFVIGAGASAEFDLPVGTGLREQIIKAATVDMRAMSEADEAIIQAVRRKSDSAKVYYDALRVIASNLYMKNSIDVFLDHNRKIPGVVEAGKLLIACCIARAEQQSKLYKALDRERARLDLKALSKTWIEQFARILFDVEEPEMVGEQVSVVCFNYDRCIELYLTLAITQTFPGVDFQTAQKIVDTMEIIHPYGTLGKLPASLHGYGDGLVPFGPDIFETDLWTMTRDLKIFTEREHDEHTLKRIRSAVAYADNLIFMGFGFAPQNMELLDTSSLTNRAPRKHIYVTGRGISEEDEQEVQRRIRSIFAKPEPPLFAEREPAMILRGATCRELFDRNYLSFSS